jgi:hypothetical protein
MNPNEQLAQFNAAMSWCKAEKRRLLKIIRTRGARGKHDAWKKLLEIANRTAQLGRELKRFLRTAK